MPESLLELANSDELPSPTKKTNRRPTWLEMTEYLIAAANQGFIEQKQAHRSTQSVIVPELVEIVKQQGKVHKATGFLFFPPRSQLSTITTTLMIASIHSGRPPEKFLFWFQTAYRTSILWKLWQPNWAIFPPDERNILIKSSPCSFLLQNCLAHVSSSVFITSSVLTRNRLYTLTLGEFTLKSKSLAESLVFP